MNIGVPYKRKWLYLAITAPLVVMYVVLAWYLWTIRPLFTIIYLAFFLLVMPFQSYNCIYWKCPHVGTLCPGAGGFCIPSSYIARFLIKHVKRSEKFYDILCSIAYVDFFGIILFPMYFLFTLGIGYLVGYILLIAAYAVGMFLLICPTCGACEACPGGQTAIWIHDIVVKQTK